jgi:putative phosphoesterase
MTLLVLSDSHGKPGNISEAVSRNKNAEAVIFLGDGVRDLDRAETANKPIISVRGNCDTAISGERQVYTLNFGEYNIMLTHGHLFSVKSGLDTISAHAAECGADIVLFGHTHKRYDKYLPAGTTIGGITLKKPLRLFNPGSIGEPRDSRASFGLITLRGKDILTSHGEL